MSTQTKRIRKNEAPSQASNLAAPPKDPITTRGEEKVGACTGGE